MSKVNELKEILAEKKRLNDDAVQLRNELEALKADRAKARRYQAIARSEIAPLKKDLRNCVKNITDTLSNGSPNEIALLGRRINTISAVLNVNIRAFADAQAILEE